jgi:hypothetical protein
MKTFICFYLARVFAASVAVISTTSSPSDERETTISRTLRN